MNALGLRITSAVLALLLLFCTYYFFSIPGLIVLGFLICFVGTLEYQALAFKKLGVPVALRYWFLGTCLLLMILFVFKSNIDLSHISAVVAIYMTGTLWLLRGKTNNEDLLSYIAISALGFIYCAMLPVFALKILSLPLGVNWFLFLLGVVFGGDIFAYVGGLLFGKTKIMPNLSPNKTLAGAVFGSAGSILFGAIIGHFVLTAIPSGYLIGLSLLAAILAQSGDLFESLLKRVSAVKDSGAIMPGHGGVLDRLDGIYFAAPLIYSAALALSP